VIVRRSILMSPLRLGEPDFKTMIHIVLLLINIMIYFTFPEIISSMVQSASLFMIYHLEPEGDHVQLHDHQSFIRSEERGESVTFEVLVMELSSMMYYHGISTKQRELMYSFLRRIDKITRSSSRVILTSVILRLCCKMGLIVLSILTVKSSFTTSLEPLNIIRMIGLLSNSIYLKKFSRWLNKSRLNSDWFWSRTLYKDHFHLPYILEIYSHGVQLIFNLEKIDSNRSSELVAGIIRSLSESMIEESVSHSIQNSGGGKVNVIDVLDGLSQSSSRDSVDSSPINAHDSEEAKEDSDEDTMESVEKVEQSGIDSIRLGFQDQMLRSSLPMTSLRLPDRYFMIRFKSEDEVIV